MTFRKHDWRKLQFERKGITGEISIKENERLVDRFIFNDKKGYKDILNIINLRYGFGNSYINVKEETEKIRKELDEEKEKKEKGFLDKDWEW